MLEDNVCKSSMSTGLQTTGQRERPKRRKEYIREGIKNVGAREEEVAYRQVTGTRIYAVVTQKG